MSSPWGSFSYPFDDQPIPYHTTQWNPYPPTDYPDIPSSAGEFNIEPTNEDDPEEDPEEDPEQDASENEGEPNENDEDSNEDEEVDNDDQGEDEEEEEVNGETHEDDIVMPDYRPQTRRPTIGARMSVPLVGPTFSFNLITSSPHSDRSPPRNPDFRRTIQSWREEDEILSVYETGQSSNGPPIHDLTGEPIYYTVPLLVARGIRTETQMGDMSNGLNKMEGYIDDLTKRVEILEGRIAASEMTYQQLCRQFGEMQVKWETRDKKVMEQENQNQQRWNAQQAWNQMMEHRILMAESRATASENRAVLSV